MDRNQLPTYSFVYAGQRGTLDYAFSSDALLEQVQQAYIWNANAAFPANMALPQPWLRFSDHDPVVVEIALTPLQHVGLNLWKELPEGQFEFRCHFRPHLSYTMQRVWP